MEARCITVRFWDSSSHPQLATRELWIGVSIELVSVYRELGRQHVLLVRSQRPEKLDSEPLAPVAARAQAMRIAGLAHAARTQIVSKH